MELLRLRIDKNYSPLWTTSAPDRRLSATLKNRTEDEKLQRQKNVLDKNACRFCFKVEKVKNEATAILVKTTETSGTSGEGVAPTRDEGLLKELKPHFQNGFYLSTNRLKKWKFTEKKMKQVIGAGTLHHLRQNNQLVSKGRKQKDVHTVQKLISHLSDHGELKNIRSNKICRINNLSSFADHSDIFVPVISESNKNQGKPFLSNEWEEDITNNYLASVRNSNSSKKNPERLDSMKSKSSSPPSVLPRNSKGASQNKAVNQSNLLRSGKIHEKIERSGFQKDIPIQKYTPGNIDFEEKQRTQECRSSSNPFRKRSNSNFPRWKKELLREAPKHFYSERGEIKINVTMSKERRAKELNKMVLEHVCDPKVIAKKERQRREFNRLHLRTTLNILSNNFLK